MQDIPRKPCPFCQKMIAATAVKCRFCNSMLVENPPAAAKKQRSKLLPIYFVAIGVLSIPLIFVSAALKDKRSRAGDSTLKMRAQQVDAANLVTDFVANETAANEKYKGRYWNVTGVVEESGKSMLGSYYVVLTGDANSPVKIDCYFDEESGISNMAKGQQMSILGKCYGIRTNVQMRGCEF